MKRLRVVFRPSAIADLSSIHDWVFGASASRIVSRRFVDRITSKCRKLGSMPHGGRPRDDLQHGLRTFPFERTAVILYQVGEDVEIIRIYFAGQNFAALFQGGPSSNNVESD
jgi:toxin ParE1/3/4